MVAHGGAGISDREGGGVGHSRGLLRAQRFVYISVPLTPVKCPLSEQGTHIKLGKERLVFLETPNL